MKTHAQYSRGVMSVGAVLSLAVLLGACSAASIPRFGVGGKYEEGRDQFFRGKGGDVDKAVDALEFVVSKDPTYKNSMTYLGRAYYRKGRYRDAYAILQRALRSEEHTSELQSRVDI